MKFRYYLRGIGIGIIFASVIFLAAYRENPSHVLTDDEIRTRAKEMGMVEADAPISDLLNKTDDTNVSTESNAKTTKQDVTEKQTTKKQSDEEDKTEEKSSQKDTAETKTTESETTKTDTTEKQSTEEENTEKTTTERQTTEKQTTEIQTTEEKATEKNDSKDNKTIEITIKKGSSSYPVCQQLQELGLIDDAAKFDDYLIENGYANRIRVGTHKLKKGVDYHTIAELISDPLD